jgi:hypothetical protein
MDLDYVTTRMSNNAEAIRALVQAVTDEQARWRPEPTSWSILEVINHLYDEETEDFRAHLDVALHQTQPWSSIDPQGWVTERQYNERDLEESLHNFLHERQTSLAWLRGLSSPDWHAAYSAPFGQIAAGDILASWVAHDLLHTRQLVELHWAYTSMLVRPYRLDYAGPWF